MDIKDYGEGITDRDGVGLGGGSAGDSAGGDVAGGGDEIRCNNEDKPAIFRGESPKKPNLFGKGNNVARGHKGYKKPARLYREAKGSIDKLKEICDAPDTPAKIKAQIYEWIFEQVYGKAPQSIDMEATTQSTGIIAVAFEGKLDEWSK